ncbi:MAG: hypothetical protein CVU90_15805 [Firmicutes bacterium HGW-Firmicutes-15]|nr:MAG: hypothetical protein CVU90_15805 [Firmicutes bacterium HGW-Firmicutes-15]
MFATFLNKEDRHSLDLSAFINYNPEQLMFYYYKSWINVSLDTYLQMKEWLANGYGNSSNLEAWLNLIEVEMNIHLDLLSLQENEYLNSIGPYYYGPSDTQFYFSKLYTIEHEALTSSDFAFLFNFHNIPHASKDLQKYSSSRKVAKKSARNKDELIRDITMCVSSLEHIENLSRYSRYLNILLEERNAILAANDILPPEPTPVPDKPFKPEEPPSKLNRLLTMGIPKRKQQDYQKNCSDYNRNMKIYFIRCREYEKACDRYKDALQDWSQYRQGFMKKCQYDLQEAVGKLNEVEALLDIYHNIINKSFVHSNYQKLETLNSFKRYLQTGRANDIQDCMNIYEEERLWTEIKASQERIENTIHFLQCENDALSLASEQTARLIASARE